MRNLLSSLFLFTLLVACSLSPTNQNLRFPSQTEQSIGIYSGTFDPIHIGHLEAAERMADQAGIGQVVIIPNLDPKGKNPISLEKRWSLISLAISDKPHFYLPPLQVLMNFYETSSPIEAAHAWVESQPQISKNKIYHMMGDDSFEKLLKNPMAKEQLSGRHRWNFIVLRRTSESTVKSRLGNVEFIEPRIAAELSSTQFRAEPLLHESLLPKKIAAVIKKEHLYGRGTERGYYDLPENLTEFVDKEQWLNQRIEDTTKFASINEGNTLPKAFLPENRPIFYLYTVDVPETEVVSFGKERASSQVLIIKNGKTYVRFFIHPLSKSFFEKALSQYQWKQEFLATPLSSHRSLLVWNPNDNSNPMNIKVTLDADIGSSRRLLTKKQIQRGYATSALLKTIDQESLHKNGIYMLDEPSGFYLKNFEFGFSTRDLPPASTEAIYLPMFSLYSKPAMGPPPIVQMIRKSGMDAKSFIQKFLIDRMVLQASILAFEHGLVGEPHEQNVLIEIADGIPTGNFVYRDFGGYTVNEAYRRRAGKDMAWMPPEIDPESLKSERADLMNSTDLYLKESNFFALEKAVEPYFPEISHNWIEQTYRDAFSISLKKYFGQGVTRPAEMRKLQESGTLIQAPRCDGVFQ